MTRLVLAPGLRVIPRGPDQVQVGIGRHARLRLPVTRGLLRALAAVDRGESLPTDPASRRALAELAPVLVDADQLAPRGVGRGDAAAAALADPAGFADRLARRGRRRVAVTGDLRTDAGALLQTAGFLPCALDERPDAVLALYAGEPDRAALDPLLARGVTHQLVRAVEGELVIGPLVVPGRSPCLRCLDAHHACDDPLHPALVDRHHRAVRHDGVAEPVDSALAALATAWAVRDLTAHLDGERPPSVAATVHVSPDLGALSVVAWAPHPGCGCAWFVEPDQAEGRSATMTT